MNPTLRADINYYRLDRRIGAWYACLLDMSRIEALPSLDKAPIVSDLFSESRIQEVLNRTRYLANAIRYFAQSKLLRPLAGAVLVATIASCSANVQPTPGAIHPEATHNPGMEVYSTKSGFSFQYPNDLVLNGSSTPSEISFLQTEDGIKAQRLLVEITPSTSSLVDFSRSQLLGNSQDFPISEEPGTIDNHETLALTKTFSMQDYCHMGSNDKIKRTIEFLVRGPGIIISFITNNSCDTMPNDWFSQIPPTINFT